MVLLQLHCVCAPGRPKREHLTGVGGMHVRREAPRTSRRNVAMAGTKEIRLKIKSIQNTRKITKAMEMVAASKMRKAQDRMRQFRPYGDKIRNIVAHLALANPEYRRRSCRSATRSRGSGSSSSLPTRVCAAGSTRMSSARFSAGSRNSMRRVSRSTRRRSATGASDSCRGSMPASCRTTCRSATARIWKS